MPTPGVRLEFESNSELPLGVQPKLYGVPGGQRFFIWLQALGEPPSRFPYEFEVNANAELEMIVDGKRVAPAFSFPSELFAPGEPVRFLVASVDRTILTFTERVPVPLEASGDQGQHISMILESTKAYRITVDGLGPAESVRVAGSSGLIHVGTIEHRARDGISIEASARGELAFRWTAPVTFYQWGGQARLTVTGQETEVGIDFAWGTAIRASGEAGTGQR